MSVILDTRSHFSLGESLLTPTEIVEEAARLGYTSVALTDTMRITGMVEFIEACKKHKIAPIIGARLRIVNSLEKDRSNKRNNRPYFLRVLIKNDSGYRALLRLLSLSYDEDHFYEVSRLLLDDVARVMGEAGDDAVVVTLGDFYGAHAAGKAQEVVAVMRTHNVPVMSEIIPLALPHFTRMTAEAYQLSLDEGVGAIISAPYFYKDSDQADSLDLLNAITHNLSFDWIAKHFWREFTCMDHTELNSRMIAVANATSLHHDIDPPSVNWFLTKSLENTLEFPNSVVFNWEKEEPSLPIMAVDHSAALVEACEKGWRKRLFTPVFGYQPTNLTPYRERLDYELEILQRLKFEPYFLLVSEIVNWSKDNGVTMGPGRGSVGGSLVAFLMGITDIDPMRFNLLFERFINPDRIDLPDADLDFMSTRREDIISQIKSRFGDDYVAAVSNYNTLAPAGALKDSCAKLNVVGNHYAFGNLIPKEHGQPVPLIKALAEVPELVKFAKENPVIVQHALNIENRVRNYSKHAAGIVVAAVPISDRGVVERRDGQQIVCWDKDLVESFGLVKIDILGLSILDAISIALRHIQHRRGKRLSITDIPIDDPKVMEAFGRGDTVGVFQFESPGMRRLLKDMAFLTPLTFDDIAAANALYRPGPMDSGLMEQFIKIKQGDLLPTYPHASMTDALKDTYGVMVYQEEVMQVSRDFAGFTLIEADHLRKAMGKKDKDKMRTFRDKFTAGAVKKHGVNPVFAGEIFDQIEKFAGYGFNKSHAAAYSIIASVCMWLKVYYPVEYFSGLLSIIADDRRPVILTDMKKNGLALLPPDINNSANEFLPLDDTTILMPFNAIKGVSDNTGNAILAARQLSMTIDSDGKPVFTEKPSRFSSMADFEARVEKRKCNIKHRSLLDKVGAFARIESTQLPSTDHTRRRDQTELLEGLIMDSVIVDREGLSLDSLTVPRLAELMNGWKRCDKCELSTRCHPKSWIVGKARVMIVMDAPNFKEEGADQMGHGSWVPSVSEALGNIGLKMKDVYVTSLMKTIKPKDGKWPNEAITQCPTWLDQEIELLKPPVIVVLGTMAFKHLIGGKDSMGENLGRVIYDKKRDCNTLIGFNPGQIYHDPGKQDTLNKVFEKLPDIMSS